jgi:tuberous sclerosis 2
MLNFYNIFFQHAVEKLWCLVQDLLREEVPKEQRHIVFQFLCNLAQGQADKLGNLRAQFFRLVATHALREDIGPRLDLLRAITDNGKDIQYIDTEVRPSHVHPSQIFIRMSQTRWLLFFFPG